MSTTSSLRKHYEQDVWQLSKEVVADLKEVFMLFDKDEDERLSKCYELIRAANQKKPRSQKPKMKGKRGEKK